MFQPVGGMDQFPQGFERAIGASRITFNADVQSVHQSDTGVNVVYVDTRNGSKRESRADFVVVCMPLSVLSGVDINLSPELMTAVKATTYSNSAKMGLAMKRRFWEEDDQIFGGHLYSNLPLGEFSYPSNDYFSKKGVLLGLYVNGPVGDLLDRPIAERVEHVLTHASKVHPQIRHGVRKRVRGVVAQGEVQPGRLRGWRHSGAPRATRPDRQPRDHRLGRDSAPVLP